MRICTSINTSSQANVGAPSHDRPTQTAGPVRPPCAQIRFWRAASRERLRRRLTPTRHPRGAPAGTALGGRVGDRGAPGADDGVTAEPVQSRPGHSSVGAVDVCTATPQASRRGGWRRCMHKCAPPGCWGNSPRGRDPARRHARRIAARRRAQPATDTFRKSAPPVSAGSMPTVTVSALPPAATTPRAAPPPGLLPASSTVMAPPVPPVAAHQEPPSRRCRRCRWGGYDPPAVVATLGRRRRC
jgi:hypothetical protein